MNELQIPLPPTGLTLKCQTGFPNPFPIGLLGFTTGLYSVYMDETRFQRCSYPENEVEDEQKIFSAFKSAA